LLISHSLQSSAHYPWRVPIFSNLLPNIGISWCRRSTRLHRLTVYHSLPPEPPSEYLSPGTLLLIFLCHRLFQRLQHLLTAFPHPPHAMGVSDNTGSADILGILWIEMPMSVRFRKPCLLWSQRGPIDPVRLAVNVGRT
jgi:hypothetical protein